MTVVFINTKKLNSSLIISTFSIFLIFVVSFKLSATQATGSTVINPCGESLGRIADKNDTTCQIYFYCFYNGFNISYWKLKCPNNLVFRPLTRTCVSSTIYPCNKINTTPSCPSPATSSTAVPATTATIASATPSTTVPVTSPSTVPTTASTIAPTTDPASPSTTNPASPSTTVPATPPTIAPTTPVV